MAQAVMMSPQEQRQAIGSSWWVWLVWGIGAVLLGILMLTNPVTTALNMTIFIGIWWVVSGIIDVITAIVRRRGPWGWFIFTGILSIIAGAILVSRPIIATVVLASFFYYLMAFMFIFVGLTRMFSGYRNANGIGYKWTWGSLVIGILLFILGLSMLFNAELGDRFFTVVGTFGILAIVAGITSVIFAFQVRSLKA
jgi:uncharacterized membrane protein HdeD (DUF308 family)